MQKIARFAILTLIVPIALAAAPSAYPQAAPGTEARIALVIGNGSYPNVPLKNPVNDARDLAAALKNLGFSVSLVTDGDFPGMSRAIRDFGNAIKRPDAVALFYYSGHGVQYRGANYLIPAKSDIQDPDELSFSAVNADQVYAKMESSGDKTNLIILDACRNNPFPGAERASERGLAVVGAVQPPQSLIVYATAPGKTAQDGEGKNGVFTAALLKHLAEPSLDAELMIRRVREDVIAATGGAQVPWHNSSISGAGFAFAGGGRLLVATDPPGAEVFVDGQRKGVSPLALADLPRYSEIEVSARSGSKSASRRLTIVDAAEASLQLSLQTARGSILVAANEPVIAALVDGSKAAISPAGAIEGVEIGLHSLELRGDSSGFKAQVEVSAGRALKVSATLVPMGSLTLSLPEGTSCAIEGPGLKDSASRRNYGPVPAGRYRLTVTGGDYEDYAETVVVERGKSLDFAPAMRYAIEYLSAKYGAELARLRTVAASGAASQADVDEASIAAKKIRAEGRSELGPLAARADALRATLASLRPAAAPAAAAVPAAAPSRSTGTLTLVSDPPGMSVVVDGDTTYQTPVSLELAPGAHSFEPKVSRAKNSMFYAAQSLQWITVTAGGETRVPIRIKPAMATLKLRLVPSGYTVFVNNEEKGVTPLGEIEVQAGGMDVVFRKEGAEQRRVFQEVYPDGNSTISWGVTKSIAFELARKTIALDGKKDSWEGVDPIYEPSAYSPDSFLTQKAYGIKGIYICKDEKYLYWRVDFNESNPFVKRPNGIGKGLALTINFSMEKARSEFDMAVTYDREKNQADSNLGSWDNATKKWSKVADGVIATRQSKDMLVAKLDIKWASKYLADIGAMTFTLENFNNSWQSDDSTTVKLKLGFLDFTK